MSTFAVVALVLSWGPYAIVTLVLSVGVGIWCMLLYQNAGKKGWLGFALGFVLTFVFFIVGAIIALIVAYRQRSTASGRDRVDLLK